MLFRSNMPYEYFSDEKHIKEWLAAECDLESFKTFLDRYIYGVDDFYGYLQQCGGLPRMQELRRLELLIE